MSLVSPSSNCCCTEATVVNNLCLTTEYVCFSVIQIQERSPRFFPVLKARCFGHDEDETNIRLTSMEDNIQKILDRFENEVSCVLQLVHSPSSIYSY